MVRSGIGEIEVPVGDANALGTFGRPWKITDGSPSPDISHAFSFKSGVKTSRPRSRIFSI